MFPAVATAPALFDGVDETAAELEGAAGILRDNSSSVQPNCPSAFFLVVDKGHISIIDNGKKDRE